MANMMNPVVTESIAFDDRVLLKDCASGSQSFFGSFLEMRQRSEYSKQLAVLRSNDTIELYRVLKEKNHLVLVTKY